MTPAEKKLRESVAARCFVSRLQTALLNPHREFTQERLADLAVQDADHLLAALRRP